jgi:hypothetical protein
MIDVPRRPVIPADFDESGRAFHLEANPLLRFEARPGSDAMSAVRHVDAARGRGVKALSCPICWKSLAISWGERLSGFGWRPIEFLSRPEIVRRARQGGERRRVSRLAAGLCIASG